MAVRQVLEDLAHLAADLGKGGADGVGHRPVADVDDLGDAGESLRHQEAAAPLRSAAPPARRSHAVHVFFDRRVHASERRLDEVGRQVGHATAVADIDQAGGARHVGGPTVPPPNTRPSPTSR